MSLKIKEIVLHNIRSFRSARINCDKDIIFVGQNDHGKSSIFKILDVIFNRLKKEYFQSENALPDDIYSIINPALNIRNQARRIEIILDTAEKLSLTFKEASVTIFFDRPQRGVKSDKKAIDTLFSVISKTSFVHIPSARDVSSIEYGKLFQKLMFDKGLNEIVPHVSGGTRKEYRLLKNMRDKLSEEITPFLDKNILPSILKNIPLELPYELRIAFKVDLDRFIRWVNESLSLGVQLDQQADPLPISEVGSGVQSLLLLAIQRVLHHSQIENKNSILAIEEPESFLHPQAQRNFADFLHKEVIGKSQLLVTTHSPYFLNTFKLNQIHLVRKKDKHISYIYVPEIKATDSEILNNYNNEINSEIFFAKKVVFVEGDSDQRVLYQALYRLKKILRGDITLIQVHGNKSFSPYLRLIGALKKAEIPWGLVTDFDSLINQDGERPLLKGILDSYHKLPSSEITKISELIDSVADADEARHIASAKEVSKILRVYEIQAFIFPSDIEWALCSDKLKAKTQELLKQYFNSNTDSLSLEQVRRKIGSKGIPVGESNDKCKKPFFHEKIAEHFTEENVSQSIRDVVSFICQLDVMSRNEEKNLKTK